MTSASVAPSAPDSTLPRAAAVAGAALGRGLIGLYLSVVVLIPIAALIWHSRQEGGHVFWQVVTQPEALATLKLTFVASLIVAAINAVAGTAIAWVLVRDSFRGKGIVNSVIDLPFALPTIVASLVLLVLYGNNSPIGIHIAYTRIAVVFALLFVTLPFVVRAVQPVLLELDHEMEEAAASLGASTFGIFRRVVLPNILPAILSGVALAFARAIGEFGSLVLITGNIPGKTEVSSVYIRTRLEAGDETAAAAVSMVLLGVALAMLLLIGWFRRSRTKHDR